jgi:hypothetical protein
MKHTCNQNDNQNDNDDDVLPKEYKKRIKDTVQRELDLERKISDRVELLRNTAKALDKRLALTKVELEASKRKNTKRSEALAVKIARLEWRIGYYHKLLAQYRARSRTTALVAGVLLFAVVYTLWLLGFVHFPDRFFAALFDVPNAPTDVNAPYPAGIHVDSDHE